MNLISIKDCSVYLGEKKALNNFSLSVNAGQHTAILGPNGSGKSTFIRLLMKEIYPSRFEGENPEITILERDTWSIFELRKAVSLVSLKFAEHMLNAAPLTIFDAVASSFLGTYGFFAGDKISDEQIELTHDVIAKLKLSHMENTQITALSTGQLRKVLIARAMVLKPKLILLDEPTSGLDIYAQSEFLHFLESIVSDTTIILVTHHLEEIIPQIQNVLMIKNGEIFKFGKKEDVLTEGNLSELFDTQIHLSLSKSGIYSMARV